MAGSPAAAPAVTTEVLRAAARARWRVAISLTAVMIVLYFGFIALIAFNKEVLARLIVPGLSLGILLGALVIVASWILTWIYVWWANAHYDTALRGRAPGGSGTPGTSSRVE